MKNKQRDLVLNEIKKHKKFGGKVFTKKKSKGTINKNYNPLKVNCKIYKRGSESYMKNKKISEKNEFINLLFKICLDLDVKNSNEEVEKFLIQRKD